MIWDTARWNQPIYEATRALVQLRHAHPALVAGDLRTLRLFNGVYAYARTLADDAVIVVLNPRGELPDVTVPLGDLTGTGRWLDILSGMQFTVEQDQLRFCPLRAHSAHVLIPISEA